MAADAINVHATALVCGEAGLLLRGRSGAGKSTLALDLIAAATLQNSFARLVADDRVILTRRGGRLIAAPHPAIAGLIEIRNFGIRQTSFERRCVIHAIVDLDEGAARHPEKQEIEFLGIKIYHLALQQGAAAPARILEALRTLPTAPDFLEDVHSLEDAYTKVI